MKKYILYLSSVLILIFSSDLLAQVQGGSFFVDSNTKNYTLKDNEGKREVFVEINFAKPFENKPTILTSLSLLDIQEKNSTFNQVHQQQLKTAD